MNMRKLIAGSFITATLAAAAFPAAARTDVDFFVNVAPPPARYEVVPAPRAGYVWTPGYWGWRNNRHYWVKGSYVRHRPGYYYEPARWVERGGRYYYTRPVWRAGDRDGDGVPNRYDRSPDNPYRR